MGEDDRGKHRKDEGGDSSHSHSHSRHKHRDKEDRDRHHRKKRRRHDHDDDRHHSTDKQDDEKNRHRGDQNPPPEKSLADEFEEDMWEEKPPEASTVAPKSARQSWMTESKGDDKSDPFSSLLGAPVKEKKPVEKPRPVEPGMSAREINTALRQAPPSSSDEEDDDDEDKYIPPTYTIGDAGSAWRMMKLKNIYAAAKESMRPVEEVALERMGSLQAFDEAREEEAELERRKRDRRNEGVTKVKVTGELYQQRLQKEQKRQKRQEELYPPPKPSLLTEMTTDKPRITQTDLNKLQAALLRAEMSNAPNAKKLAEDYAAAVEQFNNQDAITEVVALPASHSALLPHISREQSKSETEMTIEDMVKEERALKRMATVDRIAKDRRFKDDLDYLDENAERLATPTKRKEINLKAQSIQDYKKQQKIMENCPLCYKDDGRMPLAPVISLGTRVYLSLPTEPELTQDGAMIVPIRHAKNLAECDDDEWEEIRNFQKCLMQMYGSKGMSVLFYEDASHPGAHRHPALIAVPMAQDYFDQAPAYFTQALNTAESEWATHRPIVHTGTPELGKWGFRKRIAKEAPYFHVWFSLEGGMGHIVEDEEKWGNGEMWVRSILGGGLLDIDRSVWGKMGRWTGYDKRVDGFKKKWDKFDWTKALTQEG